MIQSTSNSSASNITSSLSVWWRDPLLWLLMLLVGALMSWLSIARYLGYNAGMLDLGNMSQAIWSGTQGLPLISVSPDGPYSRLSDHVELAYWLIVPLYALWTDPRLLLVLQAVLFVLATIPVYRLALRTTQSVFAARSTALIYLFYPIAQTSVLFDFHGDTIAMPLLLFALDALDRRAWGRYALFLALALACKHYVSIAVVGIGAYYFLWGGARRVGAITGLVGLVYGAVAFLVLRPLFHLEDAGVAETSSSYLSYYFGQVDELQRTLLDRVINGLIVYAPALLIGWRGWPWLLVSTPITLAVLLSTGPGGPYDYRYHHYALVVPFIVMAVITGTHQLQQASGATGSARRSRRGWRGDLGMTAILVLIVNIGLVDTPLNPLFWLNQPGRGLDHARYGLLERDTVKDAFLAAEIPPEVPLAASAFIGSHITERVILYQVRYPDDRGGERLPTLLPEVDYVLTDALFDRRVVSNGILSGGVDYERAEIGQVIADPAFQLVTMRDGLLLFQRDFPAEQALLQEVTTLPDPADGAALASFGDLFELVDAEVVALDRASDEAARRYRATFTWRLTGDAAPTVPYMAVSRLAELPNTRFVHLPTYTLLPPDQWQPGELVRETFDIVLPTELSADTATWLTGWYDPRHPEAALTDSRSRLSGGAEIEITTLSVE